MSWKHSTILVLVALTACQAPSRTPVDIAVAPELPQSATPEQTEVSERALPAIVPATSDQIAPTPELQDSNAFVAGTARSHSAEVPAETDSAPAPAEVEVAVVTDTAATSDQHELIQSLCQEIGGKLGSVSVEDCMAQQLQFSGGLSVNERALAYKDVLPTGSISAPPRVMIIGGIHGDEYSSISIMFRWMEILEQQPSSFFHWRFLPSANPDGLLDGTAERQNANGVDLNRNFPSQDWQHAAHDTWKKSTGSNPRRFPGHAAASEPETQWLVAQIEEFKPDVIVSVHAPYDLLDYDGPPEAPHKIGQLYLHQLGVYPGSLGNYGGVNLGIPVVTLELPSAGIMPSRQIIQSMWDDMHQWLLSHPTTLSRADFANDTIAEQ